MPSKEQIAELSKQLNSVVTHPEFIGLIEELEQAPADQRKQFVRERMNTGALARKGVPVPTGFRSVVRVFEDPQSAVITQEAVQLDAPGPGTRALAEMQASLDVTVCASFGVGLCASIGATL